MDIKTLEEQIEEMDYLDQAREFLKATNTKLTITFIKKDIAPHWNGKTLRPVYACVLSNEKSDYLFKFYGGTNDTKITEYHVLSCLDYYGEYTFGQFLREFGYDTIHDNIDKTLEIYNEWIKEQKALKELFTNEELEVLSMIQ